MRCSPEHWQLLEEEWRAGQLGRKKCPPGEVNYVDKYIQGSVGMVAIDTVAVPHATKMRFRVRF